ncbi:MAG: hypothetical protein M5U26_24735 [Planctomycetota bacterium]|nr:hypothetical protein [Planctomycetota bacterium]
MIDTVIHAVRNFGGDAIEATSHVSSVEVDMHPGDFSPWLDIYKLASKVHFGSDDTLADIDEAIDLYRRAAKLGSPPACLRLGEIYSSQEGFVNKREAIRWFREGAKREVNDCYAELSFMFANTELNFEISKCWRKYFDSLDTEDWSVDRPANKTLHFMRYLWQVKKGDTNGEHLSLLSRERDDLLQWCERRVRRLREDGTAPFVAQRDLALVRLMLFPEVPFEMMYGNIKWVDEGREYGFITGSDGKDYYLAFRLLAYLEPQNNPNGSGRLKLEKRMPVFFEYGDLDDGPAVTGVRLDVSSW